MYKSLKRVVKLLLPKQLLLKNELFFRQIISLKYKGNKHQCNICDFKLKCFVILDDTDLLCPRCGSRSRTRRLFKLLIEKKSLNGNILHFSPPRSLYEKFKKLKSINYFASDFENEFVADYNFDIMSIASETSFYDHVICYHVLEHIEDDMKAMSEMHRVLKPSGSCYIQTPFRDGEIYEDHSITEPDEREIAFGQEDHVRVYSKDGLEKRLETSGFKTDRLILESDFYLGLQEETVIIVKKKN